MKQVQTVLKYSKIIRYKVIFSENCRHSNIFEIAKLDTCFSNERFHLFQVSELRENDSKNKVKMQMVPLKFKLMIVGLYHDNCHVSILSSDKRQC